MLVEKLLETTKLFHVSVSNTGLKPSLSMLLKTKLTSISFKHTL